VLIGMVIGALIAAGGSAYRPLAAALANLPPASAECFALVRPGPDRGAERGAGRVLSVAVLPPRRSPPLVDDIAIHRRLVQVLGNLVSNVVVVVVGLTLAFVALDRWSTGRDPQARYQRATRGRRIEARAWRCCSRCCSWRRRGVAG
jgi:hypothetical protein